MSFDRNNSFKNNYNDLSKNNHADNPPMSRLFIICSRQNTEADFRKSFEKFGTIEEIWLVKDRNTNENKGVVYIKYSKTSEAAKALEEMHGQVLGEGRPIKVLVASSRQQGSKKHTDNEEEKYLRLFVIIPKEMTEDNLHEEFSRYGDVDGVSIIRDKTTKEGKGFAYIKFRKFYHAAVAFENCSAKYKAVFAEPKPQRNSSNNNSSSNMNSSSHSSDYGNNFQQSNFNDFGPSTSVRRISSNDMFSSCNNAEKNETTLNVICSTQINQDQLWRLFDIIPGLDYCQINGECEGSIGNQATVVYNNLQSATYARDKIHGLEYPPGERLIVKFATTERIAPMMGANPIFNNNNNNSNNNYANNTDERVREQFSSVPLPPQQPLADSNAPVAQRCFIVCVPQALPTNILKQVFCRFSDLIDVYLLPHRNCGYAKYASERSAQMAIETLHGAEIFGIRLKVLEAEEPTEDRRKRMRREEN